MTEGQRTNWNSTCDCQPPLSIITLKQAVDINKTIFNEELIRWFSLLKEHEILALTIHEKKQQFTKLYPDMNKLKDDLKSIAELRVLAVCPICLSSLSITAICRISECGHTFCLSCLQTWHMHNIQDSIDSQTGYNPNSGFLDGITDDDISSAQTSSNVTAIGDVEAPLDLDSLSDASSITDSDSTTIITCPLCKVNVRRPFELAPTVLQALGVIHILNTLFETPLERDERITDTFYKPLNENTVNEARIDIAFASSCNLPPEADDEATNRMCDRLKLVSPCASHILPPHDIFMYSILHPRQSTICTIIRFNKKACHHIANGYASIKQSAESLRIMIPEEQAELQNILDMIVSFTSAHCIQELLLNNTHQLSAEIQDCS
ncbi:hypothetical protein CVT26_008847 [Gymnopilus dilepis]|uniref:RING-type domain-containing protein n=1 Tax=Gymnopilus dilepis TaxID=231916 RepID=A0A409YGG6_9AGAR|nr:hypothetical protein CVT26_008847 [Gymnopilus dilepis]